MHFIATWPNITIVIFSLEWLYRLWPFTLNGLFELAEIRFLFYIVKTDRDSSCFLFFCLCIRIAYLFLWMPSLHFRWKDQQFSVYMIDSLFMIVVHNHVLYHPTCHTDPVFYINRLLCKQLTCYSYSIDLLKFNDTEECSIVVCLASRKRCNQIIEFKKNHHLVPEYFVLINLLAFIWLKTVFFWIDKHKTYNTSK